MKSLLLIIAIFFGQFSFGQEDTVTASQQLVQVVTFDGIEYIGQIISKDEHEILIDVVGRGKIYIPQYVIKDITPVQMADYNSKGEYVGEDRYATRYFITTNGLPIKKGENYILWNLYGPDFQFGLAKNFGVGIMTTWLASPIAATAKYSFPLKGKVHGAIGTMAGTMGWPGLADSEIGGGGALPYISISAGSRTRNLSFSAGYGAVWQSAFSDVQGRFIWSVGGMIKVGKRFSFVFDSFVVMQGTERERFVEQITGYDTFGNPIFASVKEKYTPPGVALIIPGIRWHQGPGKAFQFGFTGIVYDQDLVPFPVPMVQWFRTL